MLKGTFRKSRANPKEPKPKVSLPTAPDFLSREAKDEWRRLGKELQRLGLISMMDRAPFAAYCSALAQFKRAEKELAGLTSLVIDTPNGFVQQHPIVAILNASRKQVVDFGREFGLTAAARTKVRSEPPDDEEKSEDPWSKV